MQHKCKTIIAKLGFLFLMMTLGLTNALAQQEPVEMADVMRGNGKIYAVVAVCLIILFGLFFYVFTLDRKISKWEKENK